MRIVPSDAPSDVNYGSTEVNTVVDIDSDISRDNINGGIPGLRPWQLFDPDGDNGDRMAMALVYLFANYQIANVDRYRSRDWQELIPEHGDQLSYSRRRQRANSEEVVRILHFLFQENAGLFVSRKHLAGLFVPRNRAIQNSFRTSILKIKKKKRTSILTEIRLI
jgi:hypothetical protein